MKQPAKTFNHTVRKHPEPMRIDRYLSLQFPQYSRTFYQKLIEMGLIKVNESIVKPSYLVETNDSILIEIPSPEETELQPEKIPLNIIYEDKHLLVINKPAGLIVHPGAGVRSGTLVNALLYHCKDLSGIGGRLRPGIVHRLDKNTSGLLVAAKDDFTHISLQKQFTEKSAHREYKALLWGTLSEHEGRIETMINRSKRDRKKFTVADEGKKAITLFRVEKNYSFLTLITAWLKTGRSHQIRVHFSHLNHPVFGDPEYAGRNKQIKNLSNLTEKNFALNLLKVISRQALHAYRLGFEHPKEKKWMEFTVELPEDFNIILKKIELFEEQR